MLRRSVLVLALVVLAVALAMPAATVGQVAGEPAQRAAAPRPAPVDRPPEIQANDNRVSAGDLRNKILTVRLEAVAGSWRPEMESGPTRDVYAFAEEGHAPQNPGPLIRVPEGTELHVSVRNGLPDALKVHGMVTRPADTDGFAELAPGSAQEFHFKAGAPGTYCYWGQTTDRPFTQRGGADGQLTGAFIVDSPRTASVSDRVFVMGEWQGPLTAPGVPRKFSLVINGRSWPYTERLTLPFGQPAEWRVINGSLSQHPMHLHGTFYTVESRGTAVRDVIYGTEARRLVTTELMEPGATMAMRWVPDRVGNWLFHCHLLGHVAANLRLGDLTDTNGVDDPHAEHDPARAMAGLVLGITVQPGDETAAPDLEVHERRRMTLYLRNTAARYGANPAYGFALVDGNAAEPPPDSAAPLSPAIVLTKGEPVAIGLANHLPEETSIHWHGIELESYNDGVPGWSGQPGQVAPMLQPGQTFVVNFTPPRAGTFIYHTHGHDNRQLASGLYGPLIVLEPGQKFDPAVERLVLLGGAGPSSLAVEVNRSTNPTPMELKAGVKHRFRIINITPNFTMVVSLRAESGPVQWRAIAKDGAELPPAQATARPARLTIGVGETYDFEYEPTSAGELRLEALRTGTNAVITSTMVRVVR